jgi:ABC-type antimicrobial peptide transport system ATPase subunit
VLHEGEVVESGATETVFAEPKSAFTKRLLQSYEKLIEE